jgi:PST family polysaccharide transporter
MRSAQARIRRLLKNPVVRNSATLFGAQVCRKVFPLVSVPFLARCLGADAWGTVAFVLSLSELVAMLIEFGFNLSATRDISRLRDDKRACRNVMAGVLGAQAVLAGAGVALALAVTPFVPLLRANPHLVAAGLLFAVAQGTMPLWFFQGLERMRLAAGLEVFAKSAGLAAILIFVRRPQDAWMVVSFQAAVVGVSTIVGLTLAFRTFSFLLRRPELV